MTEVAQKLRSDVAYWTRQLVFQSHVAESEQLKSAQQLRYVLITEIDTRHSAETLASSLDHQSLCNLPEAFKHVASVCIRIFTLEGSATYDRINSQEPEDLPIDNRTHREAVDSNRPLSPDYFGLSAKSYVHF